MKQKRKKRKIIKDKEKNMEEKQNKNIKQK